MAAVVQRREKKDPLDTILKGLAVAQSVYGIKANMDQAAAAKEQKAAAAVEQKRIASGQLNPLERAKLGTDYQEVDPGTAGAISGFKTPEGKEFGLLSRQQIMTDQKLAESQKEMKKLAEKTAKEKEDQDWKRAEGLRGEHFKSSKETLAAMQGFKKVEAAYKDPNPTGPTDMALVYGVIKTFDPTTGVKEGEYASAENTKGVSDYVLTLYEKARSGQKLTPEQRRDFYITASRQLAGQLEIQDQTDQQFTDLAGRAGISADLVVDPRFKAQADFLQKELGALNVALSSNTKKSSSTFDSIPSIIPEAKAARPKTNEDAINSFLSE